MRMAAIFQFPANASSGTAAIWMMYPKKVIGQNSPVRSLTRPETNRNPYPSSSPRPATIPTTAPVAPNVCRNGPVIDLDPSYVKSAKKLTTPIMRTNFSAILRLTPLLGSISREASPAVDFIDILLAA
jgi:hypothetical protein